jgi:hypothetical protein
MKEGKSISETFECVECWKYLSARAASALKAAGHHIPSFPPTLHEAVQSILKWSDQESWQNLLAATDDGIEDDRMMIELYQEEKADNRLALEVFRLSRSLPESDDTDRLLRYETAIERQLYRALDHLERLQRQRRGERLPPPLRVEVTGDT